MAFFHHPTKTLVLTDLIENYGDETAARLDWKMQIWWRFIFRMWNNPKPAPEYQMGWKDKAAAKQSLERMLAWNFERIIIAHGDLIDSDAKSVAMSAWRSILETRA
ncbi:MAG: hypothetical protein HQ504_08470 [Rhodospirillaceae bacterium]|nr:hypothetical protein [Rhodospirillaceae bacterium]